MSALADDYLINGYEDAVSTKLLASHCVFCSRPLANAESIERGAGDVCAEKFGIDRASGSVDEALLERGLSVAPAPMRAAIAPVVAKGDLLSAVHKAIWHGAMAVSYSGPESKTVLAAAQLIAAGAGYERVAARIKSFHYKSKIRLESAGKGMVAVYTPKNQVFIDAIKKLPRGARRWDGTRRAWVTTSDHLMHVAASLSAAFPGELMLDGAGNLVAIPRDVQFPAPKTKPAPGPGR